MEKHIIPSRTFDFEMIIVQKHFKDHHRKGTPDSVLDVVAEWLEKNLPRFFYDCGVEGRFQVVGLDVLKAIPEIDKQIERVMNEKGMHALRKNDDSVRQS